MTCTVVEEIRGVRSWYCCACGYGPFDIQAYRSCTNCSNHMFCGEIAVCLDSPSSNRHFSAPKPTPDSVTSEPPIESSALSQNLSPSRDLILPSGGLDPNATVASKTKSFYDTGDLVSKGTLLANEAETSVAIINHAAHKTEQCILGQNLPLQKGAIDDFWDFVIADRVVNPEESVIHPSELDSGAPGKAAYRDSPVIKKARSAGCEEKFYACPFYKNNPHRWKHTLSCTQPHTLSRLRQHLKGFDRAHRLHECTRCLEVFSNRQLLLSHEREAVCAVAPHYFPAEGVGQRLEAQIEEQHRGPRSETHDADSVRSWRKWYIALFGIAPEVSSYEPDEMDESRSNDPSLQDDYRNRLRLTFSRNLPISFKATALANHLKSQQEVELRILKQLIGKEAIEEADAARCRTSSGNTKRRLSTCKGRQQSRPSRRCTSIEKTKSTMANNANMATIAPQHSDQPSFIFTQESLDTTMENTLEDGFFSSAPHLPSLPSQSSSATAFGGYSPSTWDFASPDMNDTFGSQGLYNESQQANVPSYENWQIPASTIPNDTYLPTMADLSDILPTNCPESFNIKPHTAALPEDTESARKHLFGEGFKVALDPTPADRIDALNMKYNTLFPQS